MTNDTPSEQQSSASSKEPVANKAEAITAPTALGINSGIGLELQTENLIETYQVMAEWIRFADAKAGVVLTVGGAFGGLLIPTMKTFLATSAGNHPTTWWVYLVIGLLSACILCLSGSFLFAFFCLTPFRLRGRHPAAETCPHFHAVGIAGKYKIEQLGDFIHGYQEAKLSGFQQEVLAALLIDSHISVTKYKNVGRSIRCVGLAAVFGLAYLITAQF